MRIAITGVGGFIGSNLRVRLRELGHDHVASIERASSDTERAAALGDADILFHLAGVNRPPTEEEFDTGNAGFTRKVCELLSAASRRIPVVFASSTQAALDNPYGRSKRAAEEALLDWAQESGGSACIFRLTNVFGKWSRPNYNSAVATFCYNIARGLPITINDPGAALRLVYIDDVVEAFVRLLDVREVESGHREVSPVYDTTVGGVAQTIRSFAESRKSLLTPRVGTGLVRALHATYLSFLPVEAFTYRVPRFSDPRGAFAEILKTPDCGQFSYFTAAPGVTRGEHYHHSKTEKFVVVRGAARMRFRHVESGERHEVVIQGGEGDVVETVPGWAHDITNIGDDELLVLLWANEVFDRSRPDTQPMKLD